MILYVPPAGGGDVEGATTHPVTAVIATGIAIFGVMKLTTRQVSMAGKHD